ncbi:hypothetical protein [Algihabitans albus]|uniref:hypothetical protein n=1 Tax=Algihabitans albus TaxID=2164067 RepID=UPI000E5CAB71|nr:hypothetical protein [Algihabitans albus]
MWNAAVTEKAVSFPLRHLTFSHHLNDLLGFWRSLSESLRRRRDERLARLAFLNMLTLDEKTLDDIGVTREEVVWGSRLPLHVNAALEVRRVARKRRGLSD